VPDFYLPKLHLRRVHIDAPQVDGTQEGMPATARYGIVVAIVDPAYARLTLISVAQAAQRSLRPGANHAPFPPDTSEIR